MMKKLSVPEAISQRVNNDYQGQVFTTLSLIDLGTREAVDQALVRMVKKGDLVRLARGVFIQGKEGKKTFLPSADQIAHAISREEGVTIQISGHEAAYRLGLISDMPTKPVYESSGSDRTIRMDEYTIYFKSVNSKRLALAGTESGMALSALLYLGKNNVSESTLEKIQSSIKAKEFIKLVSSYNIMPGWLIKKIKEIKA